MGLLVAQDQEKGISAAFITHTSQSCERSIAEWVSLTLYLYLKQVLLTQSYFVTSVTLSVYISTVAVCEDGPPLCPTCTGRSSEMDVTNNCPMQRCNSTLVCRFILSNRRSSSNLCTVLFQEGIEATNGSNS